QPPDEDVKQVIRHQQHEEEFNGFERQAVVPEKLGQLGPGVAWGDLDGDGWDDLVIGSGKGGRLAVFRNDGHGGFRPASGAPVDAVVTRDQTTVLIWPKPEKGAVVLSDLANYEDGLSVGSCVRQYGLTLADVVAAQESSVGPLAFGDMAGDGTLELFVGGRVIGGRYPEAASSRIYRWTGKQAELDQESSRG